MVEFVVVTGLSGAGRTQVGNTLEDLGWFVIDNLPPELVPKVAELARDQSEPTPIALVVGTVDGADEVAPALEGLVSSGATVTTVFVDASTRTLVRRYGDTKRRHPLLGQAGGLEQAIELERSLLQGVRERAQVLIDTTELNVHELRRTIVDRFGEHRSTVGTQVTLMSFGYKHGLPPDADLVLDCRFLPNPHWVEELRPLTGLDADVQQYVASFDLTDRFLEELLPLLDLLLPAYFDEGKSLLTVAFGCTGGRHRSVSMVERVAEWFRERGIEPGVRHRDVTK